MDPSNSNVFPGSSVLSIDASRSVMNPKALLAMKMAFIQRCKWTPSPSVNLPAVGSKKRPRASALEMQQDAQTSKSVRPAVSEPVPCTTNMIPLAYPPTSDDWRLDSEVKFDDTPLVAHTKAYSFMATDASSFPMFDMTLPDLPQSDEFDGYFLASPSPSSSDHSLDFLTNNNSSASMPSGPSLDSDVDRAALVIAQNLVEGLFVLEGKQ